MVETNPPSRDSGNRLLPYEKHDSPPSAYPDNPFVGLRPFRSDEGLFFFGRREQTIELLQQLQLSRFLSVVGSSGCGKSSLIRAGLIPKLEAGILVGQRDQWLIATAKPGDAPINNLAQSLVNTFSDRDDHADAKSLADGMKSVCAQAVVDFLVPHLKDSDENLLLLIDQFEELFTFGRYGEKETIDTEDTRSKDEQLADKLERERRRDEAADFVSIMLDLAAQRELPIFVVMTMRSDFIGDCDVFYGLPEAINVGQYLVPRLGRPQRQEAIENPILLYGKSISQRLLDRVLNDAGEEADQLPVMQHAMMRTWEKWKATSDPTIDLDHYEAAGTMKKALSDAAEEALSGMSEEDLNITTKLFQTLTDNDPSGRRIRRPTRLRDIEAITGASGEKLLNIISHFCGAGRSFLMLSDDDDNPLVDISHESLIRQWDTLRDWVSKEARSKDQYLRLVGNAIRYYKPEPEDELLRGTALQLALDWKEAKKPTRAWANRYHPALEKAFTFLDESKAQRDRDMAEAEQRRNERIERERRDREAELLETARKKELDQALELARQKEAAARWQRRAIYGLGFLLILAVGTTLFAVRAGVKASQRQKQAEDAEQVATDLSQKLAKNVEQLKVSLQNEQALKNEIAENLQTEQTLRSQAVKLKNEAVILAERSKEETLKAIESAQREREALRQAQHATELLQRTVVEAQDNARKAQQAEGKALATQAANQTFRDALALATSNNPTAAAKKYKEALEAFKSLPEPDREGEASVYLQLADLYLISRDTGRLQEGINSLIKASDIFSGIQSNNGQAAVLIKMRDFLVSDQTIEDLSDDEIDEVRRQSISLYEQANELYEAEKNLEGMRFVTDNLADILQRSDDDQAFKSLIWMYERLLPYYSGRNEAQERVSLYLNIGTIYNNRLHNTAEANKSFDSALKVYRDYEDKEAEARTYVDIGFLTSDFAQDDNRTIEGYVQQGLETVRTMHDTLAEANTLRYVGDKYQRAWPRGPDAGFAAKVSVTYYTRALALFQALPGTRIKQAETLTRLGTVNLAIDKSLALSNFQKAYSLYEDTERLQRANLLFNIGTIQVQKAQLEAALKSFEDALTIFKAEKSILEELRTQRAISRIKALMEKDSVRP